MNCYQHHSITAVAQCKGCGRGLCPECTNRFSSPSCQNCISEREEHKKVSKKITKRNQASSIFLELFLTCAAGLIGLFLFKGETITSPNDGLILRTLTKTIPFLVTGGFVSGWYIVNSLKPKQQPNTIKVTVRRTDDYSGCFMFIIKLFGAGFIGPYVLPFRTIYNFWRLKR